MYVKHPLEPIYDKYSKVLILGSMPSIKSREKMFYYANKSNRFWRILENLFQKEIINKKEFLLNNHIALWDVLASCEIKNSSDASIKNVKVNDLEKVINNSQIKAIFITSKKAYLYYNRYFKDKINVFVFLLPSPSSANAKYSLEKLISEYKIIKNYL